MSLEELAIAVSDGDSDKAKLLSEQLLKSGVSGEDLLKGLSKGMTIVGDKWDRGEAFLAEVLMAVDAFQTATDAARPYMKVEGRKKLGIVVIGTVKGDIHYIGKSIVAALLSSAGFKVVDLGEDVAAEAFCEAVTAEAPDILAMSCLISTSLPEMRTVMKELENRGLRKKVKVMIGGAPVTQEFVKEAGGDLYGVDAFDAVRKAKEALASR